MKVHPQVPHQVLVFLIFRLAEKYLLGIKKKDIRWGSGYLSEVRCLADSNRRRRFCRPVTKPLIQGTIL